jgi:hypothetical protein
MVHFATEAASFDQTNLEPMGTFAKTDKHGCSGTNSETWSFDKRLTTTRRFAIRSMFGFRSVHFQLRSYYLPSFEMAALSLKLQAIAAPVHDDAEVEATIALLGVC